MSGRAAGRGMEVQPPTRGGEHGATAATPALAGSGEARVVSLAARSKSPD
jgi:hypothetical protein